MNNEYPIGRSDHLEWDIVFRISNNLFVGDPNNFDQLTKQYDEFSVAIPVPNYTLLNEHSVRSKEIYGNVEPLVRYYTDVIRLCKKHNRTLGSSYTFTLGLSLIDGTHEVMNFFDLYPDIPSLKHLITDILQLPLDESYSDQDEGWKMDIYRTSDDLIFRMAIGEIAEMSDDNKATIRKMNYNIVATQMNNALQRTSSIFQSIKENIGLELSAGSSFLLMNMPDSFPKISNPPNEH